MSIYTKIGDRGTTFLFNSQRTSKADLQLEACGSVDELTSFIGLTITKLKEKEDRELLLTIQKNLHQLMAVLAGKRIKLSNLETAVKIFEQIINKTEAGLPKLHRFILPFGTELTGWFHLLRTVCRRAERSVVRFLNQQSKTNNLEVVLKYLNRLSDLFFILARKYGKKNKELEVYLRKKSNGK